MRYPKLALLVLAWAILIPQAGFSQAKPNRLALQCEADKTACVAQCRAGTFAVDPRRAECVATCNRTAAQCGQTADASCRGRDNCP